MNRKLGLLALCLPAACAASPQPYAPVRNVRYQAVGAEPFWLLTIGDDRIVLTAPDGGQRARGRVAMWPRTLPRTVDGVRSWESGDGTSVISVQARPGPCTAGGRTYEDQVRVRLSGRELNGCGGRLVRDEDE
jgi:uncharacterized membrane protein